MCTQRNNGNEKKSKKRYQLNNVNAFKQSAQENAGKTGKEKETERKYLNWILILWGFINELRDLEMRVETRWIISVKGSFARCWSLFGRRRFNNPISVFVKSSYQTLQILKYSDSIRTGKKKYFEKDRLFQFTSS